MYDFLLVFVVFCLPEKYFQIIVHMLHLHMRHMIYIRTTVQINKIGNLLFFVYIFKGEDENPTVDVI